MRPIASEWGICQRNMIANRIHGSAPSVPRAAAQPATGGSAPGTAPTSEQSEGTGLSGGGRGGGGAAGAPPRPASGRRRASCERLPADAERRRLRGARRGHAPSAERQHEAGGEQRRTHHEVGRGGEDGPPRPDDERAERQLDEDQ